MSTITVEPPDGPAELILDHAADPRAILLLGHGAGGDVDAWDVSVLAAQLPASGVSVARFRQPYRVAGRKIFSAKPCVSSNRRKFKIVVSSGTSSIPPNWANRRITGVSTSASSIAGSESAYHC